MPDYQMKVEINFPEWSSLSNSQRSLINFFMKDAALYVTPIVTWERVPGESYYDWAYDYSHIYGAIQSTIRCFEEGSSNGVFCGLTIPYSASSIDSNTTWYRNIPAVSDLQLITKQCHFYSVYSEHPDDINSISNVSLSSKIENIDNTDASIIPSNIVGIIHMPVVTSISDSQYKFQMRTSNFGIRTVNNVLHQVYYKIGFWSSSTNISDITSSIESVIDQQGYIDRSSGNGYSLDIVLFEVCRYVHTVIGFCDIDANSSYAYYTGGFFSFNDYDISWPSEYADWIYAVPNRVIFPLVDVINHEHFPKLGFAYAELYNSLTGLPANLDLEDDPIMSLQVSPDSDPDNYVDAIAKDGDIPRYYMNRLSLIVTSNHLNDNEFIETKHTEPQPE